MPLMILDVLYECAKITRLPSTVGVMILYNDIKRGVAMDNAFSDRKS
jgi:hypothetical protein